MLWSFLICIAVLYIWVGVEIIRAIRQAKSTPLHIICIHCATIIQSGDPEATCHSLCDRCSELHRQRQPAMDRTNLNHNHQPATL